jgi:hypothetical protein
MCPDSLKKLPGEADESHKNHSLTERPQTTNIPRGLEPVRGAASSSIGRYLHLLNRSHFLPRLHFKNALFLGLPDSFAGISGISGVSRFRTRFADEVERNCR